MSLPRILLINPRITSARNARFPLAVMHLAEALAGQYDSRIIDGNVDRDALATTSAAVRGGDYLAVGITVMGGPQLVSAIAVSQAIRRAAPALPIIWGGYFPTLCPDAALNSDFVDHVLRGPGEAGLLELLASLQAGGGPDLGAIDGLSWPFDGRPVHNRDRAFAGAGPSHALRMDSIERPQQYLKATYLGQRTTGYQAALGCRYRCTFCGVAAMFKGKTALPPAERLEQDLRFLKHELGADSIQFYDHNFFDREVDMRPLLEVLARMAMPWWCFARADALVEMSDSAWALVRQSRLRMAYIGAESPNDAALRDMRKGTRADQTLAAIEVCRRNGVTPELSFMLAPPHDPEGETERCFEFIRQIKRLHPATEIMLYIHTPLPPRRLDGQGRSQRPALPLKDASGAPVVYPDSALGWAEPAWVDYWCHLDAPWVSARLRQRILDFTTVLGCRFPTITDTRAPGWQKAMLQAGAAWRYRFQRYDRPWELDLLKRAVRLWDPRVASL
jgi:radical SAM superfamily enzyme YgiQ (UPF0313 family)